MKNLLPFLVLMFPVEATIPSIIGSNLIHQICRQTPYYNLCVLTLISNPQSFSTDITGLAKIMIYTIDAKATNTLGYINNLVDQCSSGKEREQLRICADRYNVIIRGDVPQSLQALQTGNYLFAEQGTYDAAVEAMSCEEGFPFGKSPISKMNIAVHDVSVVAASIVKILISS